MSTVIEIGTVPSNEVASTDPVSVAIQARIFMRQLNRMRPLIVESHMKYAALQRAPRSVPWLSVALVAQVNSWMTAADSLDMADAAREVQHWDETALMELHQLGLAPKTYEAIAPQLLAA